MVCLGLGLDEKELSMSRADELYRQTCLDILNNGFSDENEDVRPRWADGTPEPLLPKLRGQFA